MSGFVNVRLEEEKPIFNKQRVDFTPPERINHLVVCNNQLCMNLGKDSLLRQMLQSFRMVAVRLQFHIVTWESSPLRIDLTKPDQRNQIELGRKDDSTVHRLFLDPTGEESPGNTRSHAVNNYSFGGKILSVVHILDILLRLLRVAGSHLLVGLSTRECLYLNRNTQKVRSLSRWRGHLIECVGWNKQFGTETNTGPILVGTSQGVIFEAEISASEASLFNTNPDQYFRQVRARAAVTPGVCDGPAR